MAAGLRAKGCSSTIEILLDIQVPSPAAGFQVETQWEPLPVRVHNADLGELIE